MGKRIDAPGWVLVDSRTLELGWDNHYTYRCRLNEGGPSTVEYIKDGKAESQRFMSTLESQLYRALLAELERS